MIFLVEGSDYIWKRAVITWASSSWPEKEQLWAEDLHENDLISYINVRNHLVIRNAHVLTDAGAGKRVKDWRSKALVFEADKLPPSTFRRRLLRVGRHIQCLPGSPETESKLRLLANRMGLSEAASLRRFYTVTDGYWHLLKRSLGVDERVIKERPTPWDVLRWDKKITKLSVDELVRMITAIARGYNLVAQGAKKWNVIQELLRFDKTHLNALYGCIQELIENRKLTEQFLARVLRMSKLFEEFPDPPIEFLFLRLKYI